jgi:hypothetical protein
MKKQLIDLESDDFDVKKTKQEYKKQQNEVIEL